MSGKVFFSLGLQVQSIDLFRVMLVNDDVALR